MSSLPKSETKPKNIEIRDIGTEEDPYIIELHKRVVDAMKERKLVEDQSSQLVNRLKFLRGEEEKSLKEVESIKIKYKKKYTSMQQIENELKQKLELKTMREDELLKQKQFNSTMKTELTTKMKERREDHIKELMSEMIKLKEAKKQNDDLLKHIKIEEQNTNKNKYEFIKNQKILSDEKKRAKQIEKKNQTRENLENKLNSEKERKEKLEEGIKMMGEEEVEVLKRIKTTTKVHEVCKALTNIIKGTSELERMDKKKSQLTSALKSAIKERGNSAVSSEVSHSAFKDDSSDHKRSASQYEASLKAKLKDKFKISRNLFASPKKDLIKSRKKEVTGDASPKEEEFYNYGSLAYAAAAIAMPDMKNKQSQVQTSKQQNGNNKTSSEEPKIESKALQMLEKMKERANQQNNPEYLLGLVQPKQKVK